MPYLAELPAIVTLDDTGRVLGLEGGSGLITLPKIRDYTLAGRPRLGSEFGMSASATPSVNGAGVISAAIAALADGPLLLSKGTYPTNLVWQNVVGPWRGPGQIRDASGNNRAPIIVAVGAAPDATGWNGDDIATAFNGDFSAPFAAVEHRITGAATLGTPAAGYFYRPHTAAYTGHLYNASGHNEQLSGNDGRTTAAHFRLKVDNHGQGDAMAIYANCFVTGAKDGSTHFLANPAASIIGADAFAGADGVYLNPFEVTLDDLGFDAAGIGWVVNLKRNNMAGAKSAFWAGIRVQSQGTLPPDAAFTAAGAFRIGADLATGQYGAGQAAITLGADHRIYFGCANGSSILAPDDTDLSGNNYITWSIAVQGFVFRVYDNPVLQLTAGQATVTQPLAVFSGQNGVKVSAAGAGLPPVIEAIGTETDVALALKGKGSGGIILGAATDRIGFFAYAPVPKQTLPTVPTTTEIAQLLSTYGLATLT